jgi:hypothetical protein
MCYLLIGFGFYAYRCSLVDLMIEMDRILGLKELLLSGILLRSLIGLQRLQVQYAGVQKFMTLSQRLAFVIWFSSACGILCNILN